MIREHVFVSDSDRRLLERSFTRDDPEQVAGLVDHIPDGVGVGSIISSYDVTPPGGMKSGNRPFVYCAHVHTAGVHDTGKGTS